MLSEYYLTILKFLFEGVTGLGNEGVGPVVQVNATLGESKI